jgi:hypothetical protein
MTAQRSIRLQSLAMGLAAGLLFTGAALAHHGWTGYDDSKVLTLNGVIQESTYTNPHGMLRFQVTGANAKTWSAVLAPPSRMTARGLTEEMLKPGTTVTVVGYPHTQKDEEIRIERITVGGKTVELR